MQTITDAGGEATLSFDIANRLASYSKGGIDSTYAYDPFGRRIRKGAGSFLWDGDRLLAEYDASGNRTARYAYTDGFAPRQYATGTGASEVIYDVHRDHLETPRALTSASKTVVWRAAYEAFGKAAVEENPDGDATSVTFPMRFPGQYADAASEGGFHYNRHRYYEKLRGQATFSEPQVHRRIDMAATHVSTRCCIAGGGPAGMRRGLLLADAGHTIRSRARMAR